MKYLFYDVECANCFNGEGKICSFGYALADENLNLIDNKDIIINPESGWDWYVLKKILAYKKSVYEAGEFFPDVYDEIRSLFDGDVLVFGHAIENDVKYLNQNCKRYNLPFIDYKFYDTALIFTQFMECNKNPSLEDVSLALNCEEQTKKHTSAQDALLSYQHLKAMCEALEFTVDEVLSIVNHSDGSTTDGVINKNRVIKPVELLSNRIRKGKNYQLFCRFLDNVVGKDTNEEQIFKNKKVAITLNYSDEHFREMLYIIQRINDLGGTYEKKASTADIFITCKQWNPDGTLKRDTAEYNVDRAIENGNYISKMTFSDFLNMIEFDENEVVPFYEELKSNFSNMKNKAEIEEEKNNRNITLGEQFKELFQSFQA